MKRITVFTPTYNRAPLLNRLYTSLCEQTNKEFCWLVVDDGSIDQTKELIEKWKKQNIVEISYYYQKNKGKMSAHNWGADLCETELFMCVDSDDLLPSYSIETIVNHWNCSKKDNLCGIVAYKGLATGETLTQLKDCDVKAFQLKQGYDKYGLQGDTALIFRSDVLKKYAFPVYSGEKFVPESFLYDLIDQEGVLSVLRKVVYLVEYQEGGYSANIARLLFNNPLGYFDFITQRIKFDTSFKSRLFDSARYDAMCLAHKKLSRDCRCKTPRPVFAWIAFPIGVVFYQKRYRRIALESRQKKVSKDQKTDKCRSRQKFSP